MPTLPQDRTAQEWVDFYLQVENDVASGKSITKNGRSWTFEDLPEIRKARREWQRTVVNESAPTTTKRIGGCRYKTADLSG